MKNNIRIRRARQNDIHLSNYIKFRIFIFNNCVTTKKNSNS